MMGKPHIIPSFGQLAREVHNTQFHSHRFSLIMTEVAYQRQHEPEYEPQRRRFRRPRRCLSILTGILLVVVGVITFAVVRTQRKKNSVAQSAISFDENGGSTILYPTNTLPPTEEDDLTNNYYGGSDWDGPLLFDCNPTDTNPSSPSNDDGKGKKSQKSQNSGKGSGKGKKSETSKKDSGMGSDKGKDSADSKNPDRSKKSRKSKKNVIRGSNMRDSSVMDGIEDLQSSWWESGQAGAIEAGLEDLAMKDQEDTNSGESFLSSWLGSMDSTSSPTASPAAVKKQKKQKKSTTGIETRDAPNVSTMSSWWFNGRAPKYTKDPEEAENEQDYGSIMDPSTILSNLPMMSWWMNDSYGISKNAKKFNDAEKDIGTPSLSPHSKGSMMERIDLLDLSTGTQDRAFDVGVGVASTTKVRGESNSEDFKEETGNAFLSSWLSGSSQAPQVSPTLEENSNGDASIQSPQQLPTPREDADSFLSSWLSGGGQPSPSPVNDAAIQGWWFTGETPSFGGKISNFGMNSFVKKSKKGKGKGKTKTKSTKSKSTKGKGKTKTTKSKGKGKSKFSETSGTGRPPIFCTTRPPSDSSPILPPSVFPPSPPVFPPFPPISFPNPPFFPSGVGPGTSPGVAPSSQPSIVPSIIPTASPSVLPSISLIPSAVPSSTPTSAPSLEPSMMPSFSEEPSNEPSSSPTTSKMPSAIPSVQPTSVPSGSPSLQPSSSPSTFPSIVPSSTPSSQPSATPSLTPSQLPSSMPSATPSQVPSQVPSQNPSQEPSAVPSIMPSVVPSSQPSAMPSQVPSQNPSQEPSAVPSLMPSVVPSSQPSAMPSQVPSQNPSQEPSAVPSLMPSVVPSSQPSAMPSQVPSQNPSQEPSAVPSLMPSVVPSSQPSAMPSQVPSQNPSQEPSAVPSIMPSVVPSSQPSAMPSQVPSQNPSQEPSAVPSLMPSVVPSSQPSAMPSQVPSQNPSQEPSAVPSIMPSVVPSSQPSAMPSQVPSQNPSQEPSAVPSHMPSVVPSSQPSAMPSQVPSQNPSQEPSAVPSLMPSVVPSSQPSAMPSQVPSQNPSQEPSAVPSLMPSVVPSSQPSAMPSQVPSQNPSQEPSAVPSLMPSVVPSSQPSAMPSQVPSQNPSQEPSAVPSLMPSVVPSSQPSAMPSLAPSQNPSLEPSTFPSSVPSLTPSVTPSVQPSSTPSSQPSAVPSQVPSIVPSAVPSQLPSLMPSQLPSESPSSGPSATPSISVAPSLQPSSAPSSQPSSVPSAAPSQTPSLEPSSGPSEVPSAMPSESPSAGPSSVPSAMPSLEPSSAPSVVPSAAPSEVPSVMPSAVPSQEPSSMPSSTPSLIPSRAPSMQPSNSLVPSAEPSAVPSLEPSAQPSSTPSLMPSAAPSLQPSSGPSAQPSAGPSSVPSLQPSSAPSSQPSAEPSVSLAPSLSPSALPSESPSAAPSASPSSEPSAMPSEAPSLQPSSMPSSNPTISSMPSLMPSSIPSQEPSAMPSALPSSVPSALPSQFPSVGPTSLPSQNPSLSPSQEPSMMPSFDPFNYVLEGNSTLNEDVEGLIGPDIMWTCVGCLDNITTVTITGFPTGSDVVYTLLNGTDVPFTNVAPGFVLTIMEGNEADFDMVLDTLRMMPPSQSDDDFNLTITLIDDSMIGNDNGTYVHPVAVDAIADPPFVSAVNNLTLDEDSSAPLFINATRSLDDDDSETLSVRITVPSDAMGVVGELSENFMVGNVTFTVGANGTYTVTAIGETPEIRENLLDMFLNSGGIQFTPRPNFSGSLTGMDGIRVEAISTEEADGDDLAPTNDPTAMTVGDFNTKIAVAETFIDIVVAPIADLPVQSSPETIVVENNGVSDSDPDLEVDIGNRIGLMVNDTDGSETLDITLTGFPTDAQDLSFGTSITGVNTTINTTTGTVTLSGDSVDVLTVLESLNVTLANDDDENFVVEITGTATDTDGGLVTVMSPFSLNHTVIVQAAADTPFVNVSETVKPAVLEDSGAVTYPVEVALQDTDGSESLSVLLIFSTPGTGQLPNVTFGASSGVNITIVNGTVTLEGAAADIDAALMTLMIQPGPDNGEDITVIVTATATETNTTEANDNGPGVVGSEISVPIAVANETFVIPVTPLVEPPTLNVTEMALNGTEDNEINLGEIAITPNDGIRDPSEEYFIEINATSFPEGTQFISMNMTVGTIVDGFLRIPESAFNNSMLAILPPANFSGTFTLDIQGFVSDTSGSGSATAVTNSESILITVLPVADPVSRPSDSVGVEDNGTVPIGMDLASGISVFDNGNTTTGNNADSETITQIVLDFPPDSTNFTYNISGTYVGASGVTIMGEGGALVTFDATTRSFQINHTLITGDLSMISQADRDQAEADILATLETFMLDVGPMHTDEDGLIDVTVTTLDVNLGVADTQDDTFTHNIRIQAVADPPSVSTGPTMTVTEDMANIPLLIFANRSDDDDGSETLSVEIVIPRDADGAIGTIEGTATDIMVEETSDGVYLITVTSAGTPAEQEDVLDAFLESGTLVFNPRDNWSGLLNGTDGIRVNAISTEAADGDQLADGATFGGADGTSKTETTTAFIDIQVLNAADEAIVKGNAVGPEDTNITIPLSVTLADRDGSETFVTEITGGVPPGAVLFGENGREILPDNVTGFYELTPEDVDNLIILPPLHYSSPLQRDIVLNTTTVVTDTSTGTPTSATTVFPVVVEVRGIADKPGVANLNVTSNEDEPIELGMAIFDAVGNVSNLLVDQDTSETPFLILTNVPSGVIPKVNISGGINYLGGGSWQVSAEAVPSLQLPPVPNFSGEDAYMDIMIRLTSQEIDGDQASSEFWNITFNVLPVITGDKEDGFSSWGLGFSTSEAALEAMGSLGVPLSSANNSVLVDDDGSETVLSYTFDLSNLIADAGIQGRLEDLQGPGADLDQLVMNYISGVFTYDSALGTINVLQSDIGGVAFDATLFLDSNIDFSIPTTALLQDLATIDGMNFTVLKNETEAFMVTISGNADIPTVFAMSVDGNSTAEIPISLGGNTTDSDAFELDRTQSEDIYYVVRTVSTEGNLTSSFLFTDGMGNVRGLNNGDGTFVLFPADLPGLHVFAPGSGNGNITLELITVATDDNTMASNATMFTLMFTDGGGGGGPGDPPLTPVLTVGVSNGNEDGSFTLNVTAVPDSNDMTNSSVSVMISNLPPGATVVGATLNTVTGRFTASAEDVANGLVMIIPPPDFSGNLNVTLEAVASNANGLTASTGEEAATAVIDPVADCPSIGLGMTNGTEDDIIPLNLNVLETDIDGSEQIGDFVYVRVSGGGTLPYPVVVMGDPDATVEGINVVNYFKVDAADLAMPLPLTPPANFHGNLRLDVVGLSEEPLDDDDGDNVCASEASFTIPIVAVADPPDLTVPAATPTGLEDTAIALDLTVTRVDNVETNGAELISALITNVPLGSIFSAGANNGDGSWTIPVASLPGLTITPPPNYAGLMNLTLVGIALELDNGDEAQSMLDFQVEITPQADDFLVLAKDVDLLASGVAPLDLNVRDSDIRGFENEEVPPEVLTFTFTNVPTGVFLYPNGGGRVIDDGSGRFRFIGTEAEANALQIASGPDTAAGITTISFSAISTDDGDVLATPVTDVFRLTVTDPTNPGVTLNGNTANTTALVGGDGNDVLIGSSNATGFTLDGGAGIDRFFGGPGANMLTGGAGADFFFYQPGDIPGGMAGPDDTITDFNVGQGDAIDLGALLTGFDPQMSSITDFVSFDTMTIANSTIILIDPNGMGMFTDTVVVLDMVTGLDVSTLYMNGNLIA